MPADDAIAEHLRSSSVDGVGVYQYHKLRAALTYVTSWRNAIDIGAHVGLWSMHLTKRFTNVYAFEPLEMHRDCFVLNAPEAELLPFALGKESGQIRLKRGIATSGDTHVSPDGEFEAEMRTLDSFAITDVDFVKIDAEGYELFILEGGQETIDKYRPAIIVEQKPGKASQYGLGDTDAVRWLMDRGYKLNKVISGDFILSGRF
jgi:FkbM family methyltransferase